MNNNWHKKEKPLLGLTGLGGGVDGLGVTGLATKAYLDEVFSTYVYKGNGGAQQITNNIDNAGKGGLVWLKNRDRSTYASHLLFDTERGSTEYILSDSNAAEATSGSGTGINTFNADGFTLQGNGYGSNYDTEDFVSWNFRQQKGFFDVVTYTGNGVDGRSISHSLGCIPGMWMVKNLDGTDNWTVGHSRMLGGTGDDYKWHLYLNENSAKDVNGEFTYSSPPTATTLSLGASSRVNGNGNSYVCYLFAGGESTADTARSVDFDGSGDYLSSATSSDLSFGTGDYTVELWFNGDTISDSPLFENRVSGSPSDTTGFTLTAHGSTNGVRIWWSGSSRINGGGSKLHADQWNHLAATRSSGTTYLFLNGELQGTTTDSIDITTDEAHIGGGKYSGGTGISHYYDGKISNVRIIKGTALYTSSFTVPYEPLTNVTNTKLLCCNNSAVTGSTVEPGNITASGDPTASTSSPFDDPGAFKFGEGGDQSVIKCGSIKTDSSNGATVTLPWEPQWLLYKRTDSTSNWTILDSMRLWTSDGNVKILLPNKSDAESGGGGYEELHTRSIKFQNYGNNYDFIYMAIRRPDPLVATAPEAATDVFAIDTGTQGDGEIPCFDSGFPVSYGLVRQTNNTANWFSGSRVTGDRYLYTDSNNTDAGWTAMVWDSNVGFIKNQPSTYQAWMWKRHSGFDVVTWKGYDPTGIREIPHNLGVVPEMIWMKARDYGGNWSVYHKGLNGGTNPEQYNINLNSNSSEADWSGAWADTAPTSTHWTVGADNAGNGTYDYIAMLFSSVEGMSKVGYYTGNGTTSGHQITLGFNPKFLIVKDASQNGNWNVFDTTRGWNGSSDWLMRLNETNANANIGGFATPNSTGFNIITDGVGNNNGINYIYYAHA